MTIVSIFGAVERIRSSRFALDLIIIDFNQNAIELVAYISFLIEYFFESIIYMLLAEML